MNVDQLLFILDDCPFGKGFNETEKTCIDCDVGFYSDEGGNQTCKPCPPFHATETNGTTSLGQCNRKYLRCK